MRVLKSVFGLAVCVGLGWLAAGFVGDGSGGGCDSRAGRPRGVAEPVSKGSEMKSDADDDGFNELTPEEEAIIVYKGTERPFSGKYYKHKEKGVYVCKRCNAELLSSEDKFDSECGWPSFDDAIPGTVRRQVDKDGMRTEILCDNCGGHLGHVFSGERLTEKDVRYCVNSLSLGFVPTDEGEGSEKAYFAGGCFWGVEYLFQDVKGVKSTRVGYMGGHKANPTYKEVCSGTTGHAEAMEVVFDPCVVSFEELAKLFFEIHDPTQVDRQGPDVGDQYRSAVFYSNDEQKEVAEKLIGILKDKGYDVVTEVVKADEFWGAEDYHQAYYKKGGGRPYCHAYKKVF